MPTLVVPAPSLPTARVIQVDTRGAKILDEVSPGVCLLYPSKPGWGLNGLCGQTKDSRGIYLPNYIEPISHIAVDVRLRMKYRKVDITDARE
jgi:type II pantothenate kinase